MILFLTSSPTGPLDQSYRVEALDHKNHFVENLKHYWKGHSRCCLIATNPEAYQRNDEMYDFFKNVFFKEIDLKEKIKDFQGIVIGISVGSMNSAKTVYVQPEKNRRSTEVNRKNWTN